MQQRAWLVLLAQRESQTSSDHLCHQQYVDKGSLRHALPVNWSNVSYFTCLMVEKDFQSSSFPALAQGMWRWHIVVYLHLIHRSLEVSFDFLWQPSLLEMWSSSLPASDNHHQTFELVSVTRHGFVPLQMRWFQPPGAVGTVALALEVWNPCLSIVGTNRCQTSANIFQDLLGELSANLSEIW